MVCACCVFRNLCDKMWQVGSDLITRRSMLCSLCQFDNPAQSSRCRACGSPLAASASAVAPTPDALPTGATLIGTYVVESVLGQGGFGITYRCHDQMLDRRVAVKEFFPSGCRRQGAGVEASRGQSANDYREARAQFLAEARVLARCHHRGIVGVHTAFEANQTAYMVMELLHGKSLAQLLDARGGRMNEAEAVAVIERVGEALGFVHDQELLHRDIKPDNLMVCDDGRVMLIDFGTAREYVKGQAQGHTIVVTPGYAPLEQYAKQARRGAFTDIYSLAATLYHLLTGQMPPAASDRAMGVMLRPVRELNPQISASVARAVEAALQMEIAKRPQSVSEFLDAMKAPAENSKSEISPAMENAITRANSVEDEDPSDKEARAWATAPLLDYSDALQQNQQSLGTLIPSVNPHPVKIAPYNVAPPAPVASAPPSLYSSGNVGYNNNSNHDDTKNLLRWFFGAVLFIGFILVCASGLSSSNSNSNPPAGSSTTVYGSSNSQPSSSYSSQSSESQNSRKREVASRAWTALPMLSPISTVALPSTKSPIKSTSAQDYYFGCDRVEFSPDGKRLAYIDNQFVLRILRLPGRKLVRTLKFNEKTNPLM